MTVDMLTRPTEEMMPRSNLDQVLLFMSTLRLLDVIQAYEGSVGSGHIAWADDRFSKIERPEPITIYARNQFMDHVE